MKIRCMVGSVIAKPGEKQKDYINYYLICSYCEKLI